MWHQNFFAGRERFHFHRRPFVSVKKRDFRAERFGGLELFADFGWRERVIDAPAGLAQLLQLPERVGAAFFLGDDKVNVERALPAD